MNESLFLEESNEGVMQRLTYVDVDLSSDKNHIAATPTTQLNQLDGLTLSHVIALLNTKEVLTVMRTGNWLLIAKMMAELKSLNFNRQTLTPIRQPRRETGINNWRWPILITQPLPQLTRLVIDYGIGSCAVMGRLDLLPPTLTFFALSSCLMCVESIEHVIFKLPALHDLAISFVSVSQFEHGLQMPVNDDQWLIPSVQHSPLLARVLYTLPPNTSFHALKTISSLVGLESLGIKHFLIDEPRWPRNLKSLEIFGAGSIVSVPRTITRLQLPHLYSHLETALLMAPENLLHFEMPISNSHCPDKFFPLISRFRNLKTLNLILHGDVGHNAFNADDLAHLPPSITLISFLFAMSPSYWQYLPPDVRVIPTNARYQYIELPCYNAVRDAHQVTHFPKNLHQMAMIECLVPVEMRCLTRIHFDFWTTDMPIPHTCLLDNLPPVLTTLTANTKTSLVCFEGIDMAERFPRLTTLWIKVIQSLDDPDGVVPWLNSFATSSLTHLGLSVHSTQKKCGPQGNTVPSMNLCDVLFPPKLRQLNLSLGRVTLPKTLPDTMVLVEIQGLNIDGHHRIAEWPLGLRGVTVTSTTNNLLASRDGAKVDSAIKRLRQRIEEKFGPSVRMDGTSAFRY